MKVALLVQGYDGKHNWESGEVAASSLGVLQADLDRHRFLRVQFESGPRLLNARVIVAVHEEQAERQ